jgi:hypothetical protein
MQRRETCHRFRLDEKQKGELGIKEDLGNSGMQIAS